MATRVAMGCGYAAFGGLVLVMVLVAAVYLRLAASPFSLDGYSQRIEQALAERLGPGWRVKIDETVLELLGWKPAVRTNGLEIRNPAGIAVVRAPYAIVSLNPVALAFGSIAPREIELRDLHVQGVIAPDGTLSFVSQGDTPVVAPPASALPVSPAPAVVGEPPAGEIKIPSKVSVAVASLIRPLVEPSGLIGGLDRARLVDARLSLVGPDGRERAAFQDVDALFEREAAGDRRFELDLRSQNGAWHVRGHVGGGKGHAAEVTAETVPIADIMLLAGLSKVPAVADVTVSGSFTSSFAGGRLARLDGRLKSSPGRLDRKGRAPIRLEAGTAEFRWDETARVLRLDSLALESEGTRVALVGEAVASDRDWRLALRGREVLVAGLDREQPAFRLDAAEIDATIDETGLRLDRMALRGPKLDLGATGDFRPGSSDIILAAKVEAKRTDIRQLVRLWPDMLNSDLRSYMAQRLRAGSMERFAFTTRLNGPDFAATFSDAPMSDGSIGLDFALREAEIAVADGLPPLTSLDVRGQGTGTSVKIGAQSGAIIMPDGRRLGFGEASYVHQGIHNKGSAAQIGFRIEGGLDALASFLRSPVIAEAGMPDFDPDTMRGRVDLRATLPLVPGKIPPLAELAIDLKGTVSDASADKLPGREKLEAGQFTVLRDGNALSIKGEGKLGGSPATFDLRLPKTGSGDLSISAQLDEAARLRRSLPAGPQVTGPVGVKVNLPLAAKAVPKVELDLLRASIDGLLPGWQKAAGKPGKLAFSVVDGTGIELRDLSLESGSVHMRGQASLSPQGGLDRADFASFKLSPGDEMRVQVERQAAGYRLTVRGNNADARPILKWMSGPAQKGSSSQDVDLDLGVNILSGFNDEAMTGVTAKVSAKGGDLRSLQFGGRFRTAVVEATLTKRDAGQPILAMRSGDAGATLRFLDFYRRMTGGRLAIDGRSGESVQEGRITIEDFGLKGEPALRRIVSQTQQTQAAGSDERGAAPISRQDMDQVLFNRLTTEFKRTGSRMDYNDAVIYGSQVGFNLSGYVDNARDRLDIGGTFVPAYALNNAFSQIPVVGLILGGGRNEGLIAVDFRVAGALSNPSVTVNPLTVVAPGILRKLFGWMLPEGQQGGAETSAAQNAAPAASRRRAR